MLEEEKGSKFFNNFAELQVKVNGHKIATRPLQTGLLKDFYLKSLEIWHTSTSR